MRKVINGKVYATETAVALLHRCAGEGYSDARSVEETLYIKKTGEFFLFGEGGGLSEYARKDGGGLRTWGKKIVPLTLADAKAWVESHFDADKYEEVFGTIEEAVEAGTVQFAVLLPEAVLDNLRKKKDASGQTVSALIIKALKDAGY